MAVVFDVYTKSCVCALFFCLLEIYVIAMKVAIQHFVEKHSRISHTVTVAISLCSRFSQPTYILSHLLHILSFFAFALILSSIIYCAFIVCQNGFCSSFSFGHLLRFEIKCITNRKMALMFTVKRKEKRKTPNETNEQNEETMVKTHRNEKREEKSLILFANEVYVIISFYFRQNDFGLWLFGPFQNHVQWISTFNDRERKHCQALLRLLCMSAM